MPVHRAKKRETAIEYAIAVLAARSLPERRLRQRLEAHYADSQVRDAMKRLRELRLIDDEAWAERFARDRFERLGKGRHRIRAELVSKGIDGRVADKALAEVVDGEAERRHAARALENMRRSLADESGRATHGKGHSEGHGAGHSEGHGAGDGTEAGQAGADPGGGRESERLKNRLFRSMLVRGYPASVVRDLLGVS